MRDATLEEQQNIQKHIDEISEPTGINFWDTIELVGKKNNFNPTCDSCPNNPQNGGSGICHCILGQQVIY